MAYTISELNSSISDVLSKHKNRRIDIKGEIYGIKVRGNHTYFDLKDNDYSINICFFGSRLDNKDGEEVIINGSINYYEKNSKLNFIGREIQSVGEGDFMKEYEKLKKKYQKKGYFDNRKDLPKNIKNIGVITSFDGAAIQDFKHVLQQNNYNGNIFVYDCRVQGLNCPKTVCEGIDFFNSKFIKGNINSDSSSDTDNEILVDVIIVMRGGGSDDDMKGFSDEKVIKKLYKSKIYTISAIGHEVDWMLSDYVANCRGATPSIAGEIISKNTPKMKIDMIENMFNKKIYDTKNFLYKFKNKLFELKQNIKHPKIEILSKLNYFEDILKSKVKFIYNMKNRINKINEKLIENNPTKMLNNDFMVLTNKKGNIITDISKYHKKTIKLINKNGEFDIFIKLKNT